MKFVVLRMTSALLTAILILGSLLSLAACGKGAGKGDSELGDTTTQQTGISDFVRSHQSVLSEVVAYITAREGLSYFYFLQDADSGKVYVEEQLLRDGALVRERFRQETLDKLAEAGFVGQLSYNADAEHGIVSFYTVLHNGRGSFLFTYCPDDAAVAYLSDGYFSGAERVKAEPIVGQWYYVEAV